MRIRIGTHGEDEALVITPIDFNTTDIRGIRVYLKNLNGGYVDGDRMIIPIAGTDILDL